MIESSFAAQYGIRLSVEDISYGEYKRLFSGFTSDTPLVQIISVRKEKDTKKIKQFTAEERKIYNDWKKFKYKKELLNMSVEEKREKVLNFQKAMKSAFFKGGSKGM